MRNYITKSASRLKIMCICDWFLKEVLLSSEGEDINEHIASSKIPGDCLAAVSKSFDVCDAGVQVRSQYFTW